VERAAKHAIEHLTRDELDGFSFTSMPIA